MDGIIIGGNGGFGISALKGYLMKTFEMKDLGELTYFLGLEIQRNPQGIDVHQQKYAEDLLSMAGFSNSRTAETPVEINVKIFQDDDSPLFDVTLY